mmetsp:Transcript_34121/g.108945  ORF Transcript_34121/g.108945 Transcript_34121/m.108945 type:complete len:213 (+) Transcript_34121:247-885(+)
MVEVCLQRAKRAREVGALDDCVVEGRVGDARSNELGVAHVCLVEAADVEDRARKVGADRRGGDHVQLLQLAVAQSRPVEVGVLQLQLLDVGPDHDDALHHRAREVGVDEAGAVEGRASEGRERHLHVLDAHAGQLCAVEGGVREVGVGDGGVPHDRPVESDVDSHRLSAADAPHVDHLHRSPGEVRMVDGRAGPISVVEHRASECRPRAIRG